MSLQPGGQPLGALTEHSQIWNKLRNPLSCIGGVKIKSGVLPHLTRQWSLLSICVRNAELANQAEHLLVVMPVTWTIPPHASLFLIKLKWLSVGIPLCRATAGRSIQGVVHNHHVLACGCLSWEELLHLSHTGMPIGHGLAVASDNNKAESWRDATVSFSAEVAHFLVPR
jgi:hypothetical protein